jgi:hypothetical protein
MPSVPSIRRDWPEGDIGNTDGFDTTLIIAVSRAQPKLGGATPDCVLREGHLTRRYTELVRTSPDGRED